LNRFSLFFLSRRRRKRKEKTRMVEVEESSREAFSTGGYRW